MLLKALIAAEVLKALEVPEVLTATILAEKSQDFFARIAVLGPKGCFGADILDSRTEKVQFFCKDYHLIFKMSY